MTALPALPETRTESPIRDHVATLHQLAAGIKGVLVVSSFHASAYADDDKTGSVTHHPVGDVEGMVEAIESHAMTPGVNTFVGLQVMRPTLSRGSRGSESDIVAVLGFVADMDADTGRAGMLPTTPNLILETSPGNRQPFWLFDRPLSPSEAKPLAAALKRATESDHGTADITHVWRVPGTLNWPNRKKLLRGRAAEPAPVFVTQAWDGSLTNVDAFKEAVGPWAQPDRASAAVTFGDIPDASTLDVSEKLSALLAADDVGDRSVHAGRVIDELEFDGHTVEGALALFLAASGNWRDKYKTPERARADFERLWRKFAAPKREERSRTAEWGAAIVSNLLGKRAAGARPVEAANDNFPLVNPADWHGKDIPERDWFVEGLIPMRQVTILGGDGGVGKSLLALQLGAASALDVDTLGLQPRGGRVVYMGAEDEAEEFHRRLADILAAHGREFADLEDFRLIPLADVDALLSVPDRAGTMQPTPLWQSAADFCGTFRPSLVVLDTAADLFGGDEIRRAQVRQFIAMLRRLAIGTGAAVVLLAHPSLDGMRSGSGSSGSTAWNNSVRSRLYLTADAGEDADPEARILTTKKNNYGKTGGTIRMRWQEGAFVLDEGRASATLTFLTKRHDETFLAVLGKLNRQGQRLSPSPSVSYAPKLIAEDADAGGVTKRQLTASMRRLLDSGDVTIVEEGPPSRRYRRLLVTSEIAGGHDHTQTSD